jgi:hypothetical protein
VHNGDPSYLYTSPLIINAIKSRTMTRMGHTALMRKMKNSYKVLLERMYKEMATRESWMYMEAARN